MATYPTVKHWSRGLQIDVHLLREYITRLHTLVSFNNKARPINLKC